ncbi:MAG TPA: DNA repair protein RadA, partial [Actinotalea sp.]|nr:DNA repair protein RadA [Actinotalea sp.]
AIASGTADLPLADHLVAIGEVGLAGELRPVVGLARRLAEARRLGFTRAVVPAGAVADGEVPQGLALLQASDLGDALRLAHQDRHPDRDRPLA